MNTYLDCPAKWSYIYRRRRQSRETAPLRLGSYIHHLADLLYTYVKGQPGSVVPVNGIDDDILEAICLPHPKEDDLPLKSQAATVVWQYVKYRMNHDVNWQILAVEQSFFNKLMTPKGRPYILEMHIDLLFRNTLSNQFFVVDHKSGSIWSQEQAECDPQMELYIAPLQAVGYPITHGIYNFLSTTIRKSPGQDWNKSFERRAVVKSIKRSENTLRNFGARVDEIIDRTSDTGVQFPMVRTKSCAFCSFNDVCSARLDGDIKMARDLLDMKPERAKSGNKRDEEKAEFLKLVEERRAQSYSPHDFETPTTITIRRS